MRGLNAYPYVIQYRLLGTYANAWQYKSILVKTEIRIDGNARFSG